MYVLKLCQYVKGRLNFNFGLRKKQKYGGVSQLCNVCFWTVPLCFNWLCQTEELDEAQTNCGLFYLASGVDYISIKKYKYCDFTCLTALLFVEW